MNPADIVNNESQCTLACSLLWVLCEGLSGETEVFSGGWNGIGECHIILVGSAGLQVAARHQDYNLHKRIQVSLLAG